VRSGNRRSWGSTWILAAGLLVVFAAVPFGLVAAGPRADVDTFLCKIEVESRLAETLEGKLEFLLVRGIGGGPPSDLFVITIDHGYTAGVDDEAASVRASAPGGKFWLQGSLMDKDTYNGEQYLLFGHSQLYVSQVKSGLFWPSQVQRLKSLYLSPFTALASVYLVWAYPFMEEYTLASWLLVIARLLLLCLAVAVAAYRRARDSRWTPGLIWVIGAYALLAIALAIPSL